jgi:hypothetical protein
MPRSLLQPPKNTEGRSLEAELAAEAEHTVLELAALFNAEVSVTQIILLALEARIMGLEKVVGLRWLLIGRWVRGCARLMLVHSVLPFSVGRVPGCCYTCGAISLSDTHIIQYCVVFVYWLW